MFYLSFSEPFKEDVTSALNYIKNVLEVPMASQNHFNEIKKTYIKLEENPYRRPLVQNKSLALRGYRSINVKNYVIFYVIDKENNTVILHRFLYSGRDWANILIGEFEED